MLWVTSSILYSLELINTVQEKKHEQIRKIYIDRFIHVWMKVIRWNSQELEIHFKINFTSAWIVYKWSAKFRIEVIYCLKIYYKIFDQRMPYRLESTIISERLLQIFKFFSNWINALHRNSYDWKLTLYVVHIQGLNRFYGA